MKHDNSNQNPWAGLSSYEDPAMSELKLKFCGRDNETREVARLIDDNFFMTLYGKSGIGKTSLLNAGVFPALRREQYTPLSLRLGMTDESSSFQDVITQAIGRAIEEIGGNVQIVNVMDEQADQDATDYLWRWFARRRFLSANGQITFPVLVFDQFEEVFRHKDSRRKTKVLLEQLNYLIDESHSIGGCVVDGEAYNYDFNFRFILSIREDDLYRLEDALDNCSLPALKHCRYRLRSLSEQGARDAILVPGEGLFEEEEKDLIVQTIFQITRNKDDNSISTNLLSLVYNRLYVESQKVGASVISFSLVDSFVKGNPFERFYNEATRGFSNKDKLYIEEHFVDSTGRRNSIPESDFLVHVKNGSKLIDGKNRILQRVSTSSDGDNSRIELIHDSFCEQLTLSKQNRLQRKRVVTNFLVLLIILLISYIVYLFVQLNDSNKQVKENLYRIYAEKISKMVDNGNVDLAKRLLCELLPENKDDTNKPWTIGSETALRKAFCKPPSYLEIQSTSPACFSPDGNSFVTSIVTGNIVVWDSKTMEIIWNIKGEHPGLASFSSNGDKILSRNNDTDILILDSKNGEILNTIICFTEDKEDGFIRSAKFNPQGKEIVTTGRYGDIRLWDSNSGKLIKTISNGMLNGNGVVYNKADYSPNGNYIAATAGGDNMITIWDVRTGDVVMKLKGHQGVINDFEYSSDGNFIVSAAGSYTWADSVNYIPTGIDNTVKLWNVITGECVKTFEHPEAVNCAIFASNNTIITTSQDGLARIWDINTGCCISTYEHKGKNESIRETPTAGYVVSNMEDVVCATMSPDGNTIITTTRDKIRKWHIIESDSLNESGNVLLDSHNVAIMCVDISQNGDTLLATCENGDIKLWNTFTKRSLFTIGNQRECRSASFVCNGKEILIHNADGTSTLFDGQTGKPIRSLLQDSTKKAVVSIASNRGTYVAFIDSIIRVWDIQKNIHIRDFPIEFSPTDVIFSPFGTVLATACKKDNTAFCRLWDLNNGEVWKDFKSQYRSINDIDFSPSGDSLLISSCPDYYSGEDFVSGNFKSVYQIWDVKKGRCVSSFKSNGRVVLTKFVDNTKIVSISEEKDFSRFVEMWDLKTGDCVGCVYEDARDVFYLESLDVFVFLLANGTIKAYEFPTYDFLITTLKRRNAIQPLTEEELIKYGLNENKYEISFLSKMTRTSKIIILPPLIMFVIFMFVYLIYGIKVFLNSKRIISFGAFVRRILFQILIFIIVSYLFNILSAITLLFVLYLIRKKWNCICYKDGKGTGH